MAPNQHIPSDPILLIKLKMLSILDHVLKYFFFLGLRGLMSLPIWTHGDLVIWQKNYLDYP